MILVWFGLLALLQSSVTLVPGDLSGSAAWVQWLLMGVVTSLLVQMASRLRRLPLLNAPGQWFLLCGLLSLFLTEGGLPGQAGSLAGLIGLDAETRAWLSPFARCLLVIGLWQSLSLLGSGRQQGISALRAGLHEAMTELVLPLAARPRPPRNKPTATVSGSLSEGLRAALEQVSPPHRPMRDRLLQEPGNIAVRLALHHRLVGDPTQSRVALLHGTDFLDALGQAERPDLAVSVAADCARLDHNFFPPPAQALALARQANELGQHAVALRLLRHFDVRHPEHPAVPEALLVSAQALGGLGRAELAQSVLGALVTRFPDDLLAADAIALSARLAVKRGG